MFIYRIKSYGVEFMYKTEEEAISHVIASLERDRQSYEKGNFICEPIRKRKVKDKRPGQKIEYYFFHTRNGVRGQSVASYRILEI